MSESQWVELLHQRDLYVPGIPVGQLDTIRLWRRVHLTNATHNERAFVMKKRLLMIVLMGVVVAAGIIAGSSRANRSTRRTSWPAATIVVQLTEYGSKGEFLNSRKLVRYQHGDGTWENHMDDRGDGTPFHSSGRVNPSTRPTVEEYARAAADFGRPEAQFLGYRVFIQKNEREEFWYAPDLDAMLKEIKYNTDGSISDITEAISVTPGEPSGL